METSIRSKSRLNSARDLLDRGLIARDDLAEISAVEARYTIGVSDHVAQLAAKYPQVAKQYIPQGAELEGTRGEWSDPIGDEIHSPVKGIVHRYPDRVLLKATHVCAVYCRYCFRREMVGPGHDFLTSTDLAKAIDYIRAHRDIWEVILSGGDPMVLSERQMAALIENLSAIEHVKVIRIHTRVPVADPKRITAGVCAALNSKIAVYIVLHINHASEITPEVERAVCDLHAAGCTLLSQSVLLRGVNDDADILEDLMRRLVEMRVKPYYIHHPDMARGTQHFRLSVAHGQKILRSLLGRMSGLCQPLYMLDIPGGHGKVPINPYFIDMADDGRMIVEDYQGHRHYYDEDGA